MSVNEAKKNFEVARKAVSDCQSSIQTLQIKADQLQESLPNLSRAVEAAERSKVSALDFFVLNSNKVTEQALKVARQAHGAAQKTYSESNELVEATARALKKQESELGQLNNACELAKRACWQAVADEIRSKIPGGVFENVRSLFVIGAQCSQTRQWLLDSLFPSPSTDEFQTIRNEQCEKYNID